MTEERKEHNKYQQKIFAMEVQGFCEPIPQEIQLRLQRIVDKVWLMKGERVLDVGTGTGVLIPYIQSYGVVDIVGCDLSSAMLAVGQERYQDVIFWCGDVVDIPTGLGPFDVVIFNAVFGNVWDQKETLSRISELLGKAGRVCISHPLGSRFVAHLNQMDPRRTPNTLPDQNRLREMIQQLPFELVHFEDKLNLYLAVLSV